MKLEHYSAKNFKEQLLKIIKKHKELKYAKVFIFGSRVRGDNFERADIDIGMETPEEISSLVKYEIEQEIENLPVLYKIDFVDFNKVSDNFKAQALKNIEYVYPIQQI